MGSGIARQFKRIFGRVDELHQQKKQVGDVAVLALNGRYIYYLITKEIYSQKPTIGTLTSALKNMMAHAIDHGVTAISMPRIGCGLDRLKWSEVEPLLINLFPIDGKLKVTIYTLPGNRINPTLSTTTTTTSSSSSSSGVVKEKLRPALDVLGDLLLNGKNTNER
jgi:hypothetical protein